MKSNKYLLILLFAFLASLPFFLLNQRRSDMKCIFCHILENKTDTVMEVETSEYVIFRDIKPASSYHYLAVPKKHLESVKTLTKEDDSLVASMEVGLKQFFIKKGIDTSDALFGFHMPPFTSVKHLHMHGIAPKSTMSFFNRLTFKIGSPWFKTVEEAREYLAENPS